MKYVFYFESEYFVINVMGIEKEELFMKKMKKMFDVLLNILSISGCDFELCLVE